MGTIYCTLDSMTMVEIARFILRGTSIWGESFRSKVVSWKRTTRTSPEPQSVFRPRVDGVPNKSRVSALRFVFSSSFFLAISDITY